MHLRWILFLAALSLPLAAGAQSYRCVGKDGKKHYGATIPPECIGQTVEQLNNQGVVVRRIEGAISAEDRAKKEAEARAAAERDAQAKEEARRSRALLAAYQSEKDIEIARKRALDDNARAVTEIEARLEKSKGVLAKQQKEMEFYAAPKTDAKGKGKPAAAAKPSPDRLRAEEDIRNTEKEMKLHEEQLVAKKKEADSINSKYDEDKKRFLDLQKAGGVVPVAGPAPAAAAKPADKKK
jgi:hypothetical protein